jgi:hypothetical protein
MRTTLVAQVFALVTAASLAACSSNPTTPTDDAGADAPPTKRDAGSDADAGPLPDPTPMDIGFEAVSPLGTGDWLLFNDWDAQPNTLSAMKPDGSGTTVLFKVNRVWSFGVSHDAKTIAFSCADPFQEQRYGITIGDAIQHTWLYEAFGLSAKTPTLLASGNINDECHSFGPGDTELWVCRRYDFDAQGAYKGWRIARIDLATKAPTWVTPEEKPFALSPQITPGGAQMLWTKLVITPPSTQTYSIEKMALPSGTPQTLKATAGRAALSPDGTRYAYTDYATTARDLWVAPVAGGGAPVQVTKAKASHPAWSPDGTEIAYLIDDGVANCQHVDVVKADGSEAMAPRRVRDCTKNKGFLTQLAWVRRN